MWIDLKQLLLKKSTNRTLISNGRQYVQLSSWILIGQKILGHSIYFLEMNCNRTLTKEIIMLNLLLLVRKKFLHNKKSLSFSFLIFWRKKVCFYIIFYVTIFDLQYCVCFTYVISYTFAFVVIQFSLVTQSCTTLCNPMDYNIPGFPVHHQLLELAQTHVHWIGDAIQPSHSLSTSSSPAFSISQHQGLFQWVSSSYQMAKVLEFQLQPQSF